MKYQQAEEQTRNDRQKNPKINMNGSKLRFDMDGNMGIDR